MNKTIISFAIAILLVGGGAFYGGLQYGKNQAVGARQQNMQRFFGQAGQGPSAGSGQGGQSARVRGGGNFVNGEIIAKDDKSLTIKNQDGGSKIIFLSDSTQISKFTAGSLTDLMVGQVVSANGTANPDGSITAQMIQLRPDRPGNATSTPIKQ